MIFMITRKPTHFLSGMFEPMLVHCLCFYYDQNKERVNGSSIGASDQPYTFCNLCLGLRGWILIKPAATMLSGCFSVISGGSLAIKNELNLKTNQICVFLITYFKTLHFFKFFNGLIPLVLSLS